MATNMRALRYATSIPYRVPKGTDRIISIYQPHQRPIVRGKAKAKVEFGAKTGVSIVNGYTYVDHLSWEAYNESSDLSLQTELYRQRFGILPKEVQADKIYLGKDNRKYIREKHMDCFNHPLIVEDVTGYCGRRNGGVQLTIND